MLRKLWLISLATFEVYKLAASFSAMIVFSIFWHFLQTLILVFPCCVQSNVFYVLIVGLNKFLLTIFKLGMKLKLVGKIMYLHKKYKNKVRLIANITKINILLNLKNILVKGTHFSDKKLMTAYKFWHAFFKYFSFFSTVKIAMWLYSVLLINKLYWFFNLADYCLVREQLLKLQV